MSATTESIVSVDHEQRLPPCFDQSQHRRMQGFKGLRKREFIAGRIALRDAAKKLLGRSPSRIYLDGLTARIDDLTCRFSISHSAGLACSVLASSRIGIDLEGDRVLPPHVLRRVTTGQERTLMRMHDIDPLLVWVIKEAVAKALGKGLAMDFRSIRIQYPDLSTASACGITFALHVRDHDGITVCTAQESDGF